MNYVKIEDLKEGQEYYYTETDCGCYIKEWVKLISFKVENGSEYHIKTQSTKIIASNTDKKVGDITNLTCNANYKHYFKGIFYTDIYKIGQDTFKLGTLYTKGNGKTIYELIVIGMAGITLMSLTSKREHTIGISYLKENYKEREDE